MAEAPHARPGAPAQGDPPLHGGAADHGQGQRFFGPRVPACQIIVALQPPTLEQPPYTEADGGEEPDDLLVSGRRGRMEVGAAGGRVAERCRAWRR